VSETRENKLIDPMRVAVVQLSSQDDVGANLARATHWIGEASRAGAKLVVLPENFAFMGEEAKKREIAEPIGRSQGIIVSTLATAAREHGVWVIGGGMPEKSADIARPYNTSVLVAPTGDVAAAYRKVHLFDVALADGTSLRESAATMAGAEPVTTRIGDVTLGMTICYDVRFPELYRKLVEQGARVVTVPSAFTLTTGKDHWHVLLRARAIEDQVFVLAPAQHGKHPRGRQTYGKSLICDPWGDVLAQCGEGEGFAVATLDFAQQDRVRASLPSLMHRKWPA
jgi:predicted amidohydrolase